MSTGFDVANHEIKFLNIAVTMAGANALVAAAAGKTIRVLALALVAAVADTFWFEDDTPSTTNKLAFGNGTIVSAIDKTGGAGAPHIILPFSPVGWFKTAAGKGLNINLVTGSDVSGVLVYIQD